MSTTHILLALLPMMGIAQAAEPETVTTSPGKDVRLGAYSVFRSKDCTAGAAPDVRITKSPQSGIMVLQDGTLATTRVPNCPKISGPVKQIIYRPNAGFSGSDRVTFDVIDGTSGHTDQHSVTIRVQ